jgi:hypothetical protein
MSGNTITWTEAGIGSANITIRGTGQGGTLDVTFSKNFLGIAPTVSAPNVNAAAGLQTYTLGLGLAGSKRTPAQILAMVSFVVDNTLGVIVDLTAFNSPTVLPNNDVQVSYGVTTTSAHGDIADVAVTVNGAPSAFTITKN